MQEQSFMNMARKPMSNLLCPREHARMHGPGNTAMDRASTTTDAPAGTPTCQHKLLYIAHFDPAEVASGTCARGRAMLQSLREFFDITLVCFSGQFERHPDEDMICRGMRRI